MVVQGILALALALPTGLLFGVGYGTGVRIGYEQVYPLLFPPNKDNRNVTPTVENIKQINGIYNAIGGKEASQMGIAMGLQGAMEEIDRNPDFQALEELELRLSGRTQSRLGTEVPSKETSISDFPSGSSLDPNSPNFDAEYFIFVNKKKQEQDFPPGFDFGNKEELLFRTSTLGGEFAPSLTKTLSGAQAFTAWQKTLIDLQKAFQNAKELYLRSKDANTRKFMYSRMFSITSKLRTISRDIRNPNNGIRVAVLQLRKELANKRWTRPSPI